MKKPNEQKWYRVIFKNGANFNLPAANEEEAKEEAICEIEFITGVHRDDLTQVLQVELLLNHKEID